MTQIFIQDCQSHSCFNILIVDLTAHIILTKLEKLVEWACLIQFLAGMLKNCFPAPYSPPLCNLDDTVKQQKSVSSCPSEHYPSFSGLCPSDLSIVWRNKALTRQKTSAPQGLTKQSRAEQSSHAGIFKASGTPGCSRHL